MLQAPRDEPTGSNHRQYVNGVKGELALGRQLDVVDGGCRVKADGHGDATPGTLHEPRQDDGIGCQIDEALQLSGLDWWRDRGGHSGRRL